jgi:serine/threonine-protein kinase
VVVGPVGVQLLWPLAWPPTAAAYRWDDDRVLIMPRAEKSLLAHIREVQAPLGVAETVAILSEVATALSDLDGRVVHRDLKPANILLLDGRWCLADFGISRYSEATTAPDTRKLAWTPQYAAPEQWRAERATAATDIYALGVIAYELLAGVRPFTGPEMHDYHHQHLHAAPPALDEVPAPTARPPLRIRTTRTCSSPRFGRWASDRWRHTR